MEKRKSKTAGAILAAATIAGDVPLSEPRKPKVTYEWNPGDLIENLDHLALAKAERLRMQRAATSSRATRRAPSWPRPTPPSPRGIKPGGSA